MPAFCCTSKNELRAIKKQIDFLMKYTTADLEANIL